MHRLLALLLCVAACARRPSASSSSPRTPPAAPSDAVEVTLGPLAPGVWLHTSRKEVAGYGRIPSHGLVVEGREALLLVDTAWGDGPTRELLAMIRARLGRVPTAAVVTHAHDDRVGGLAALRAAGVAVYATADTAARVAAEGGGGGLQTLSVPVDRRALAGEDVEVFAPGPAHTPDNVVVWLPAREILFGGCMIRPAGARALGNLADADVTAWPASALRVEERYPSARVVVPSHGDPGDVTLLAATTALAHALLPGDARIRRGVQLPVRDGTTVTVCGTYGTRNLAPHGPPVTKPALALEGEADARVTLDPVEVDASWQGRRACARGTFTRIEPLRPGDPPHASRRSGWWLSGATLTRDEADAGDRGASPGGT